MNKMAIKTYISITTLNVNGLNAPSKNIEWLNGKTNKQQKKTLIYVAKRSHFRSRDKHRLIVKRWKKLFQV